MNGQLLLTQIAAAWKKLFALPSGIPGVTAAQRTLAVDACTGLQGYLKSYGGKEFEGCYVNVFKFPFQSAADAKAAKAAAAAAKKDAAAAKKAAAAAKKAAAATKKPAAAKKGGGPKRKPKR